MKKQLTDEQIGVINEFVELLKNETGIATLGMLEKRMNYDFIHGKGQTIELLNENFYDIIANNDLQEYQIKKLAKEISRRENKWIIGKLNEFNFNDVIFDGSGYVVISNGTRIDIEAEFYKQERDAFNKVRTERLEKNSTSGKEYL